MFISDYEKWHGCTKVTAFDWIDGENVYINIQYYRPGSNICKPPAWEKSFLIPGEMAQTVRNYMDSVVYGLATGTYPSCVKPLNERSAVCGN